MTDACIVFGCHTAPSQYFNTAVPPAEGLGDDDGDPLIELLGEKLADGLGVCEGLWLILAEGLTLKDGL